MKSHDRRKFLKQAGATLALGAVGGTALLKTEQRVEATGTYRHFMLAPYYVVYPFPAYFLNIYGDCGYRDGPIDTPPDYYEIFVQDQNGNDICGPYTKTAGPPDNVGQYAISIALCGPLNAGSIRVWIDAYWGSYSLTSDKVYGQNTNPTANAYIPCYSGC